MEIENKKSKYQKIYEWGKQYYWRWRKEKTTCSAFGDKAIKIDRTGWHHLVGTRARTKAEKVRRIKILPLAKKLIKESTTYQDYRYEKGWHYFALQGFVGGKKIKVILSGRSKEGKKTFLSVIDLR